MWQDSAFSKLNNNPSYVYTICSLCFVFVQLLSHDWLFASPWAAAQQASLSFTIALSLLKLMSTESVMPSIHLILCCPLSSCLSLSQHQGLCLHVMFLLFNTLSRFVIAFLPRSKHLLIVWLQLPSTEILEPKKIKSVTVTFSHLFAMKWWDWISWS